MSARWRYILQEAMTGLRRNLMMTVAVILSVAVSLTLLGASLLLSEQVDLMAGEWTGKIEVSIFLCDGAPSSCPPITPEQQQELEEALTSEPIVERVYYESKQDAYEKFREQFREQPELLETVTPESLPPSFRVKLKDPERFEEIRDKYQAWPGIDEIVDQREILKEFLRFANVIRRSAIAVALIQLVAASVLIANTIRVAAFARREQTSIMKLVGASNWYIRLPFVLEGVIAGVMGALVAWGLMLVSVPRVADSLRTELQWIPFLGLDAVIAVGPTLVLLGGLLAAVASVLSLRRFLQV